MLGPKNLPRTTSLIGPSCLLALLIGCEPTSQVNADADSLDANNTDLAVLDAAPQDGSRADASQVADTGTFWDAAPDDLLRPDGWIPDNTSTPDANTDPDAGETEYTYRCTAVGTAYSDGLFALASYQGHIYAGLFGYGHESQSMLYRYPSWQLTSPGLLGLGESVCMLREYDGQLYANTEDSGDIFRSQDGDTWTREYDGPPQSIGCGLAELNGTLYALNYSNHAAQHGRILRRQSNGSWEIVYDSGSEALYLREIVFYSGKLYAFAVSSEQGVMLSSSNGTDWTRANVQARFFRGYVHNGFLWLGSASFANANGIVAIWRYDGQTFTQIHQPAGMHVTDVAAIGDDMFATTSNGWKQETGPSHLLLSKDSGETWQQTCTFSDTAAWKMVEHNGEIYVGTWTYGGHGSLFRVERVTQSTEDIDCSLISSANASWHVCESSVNHCAGAFDDYAGCNAYCAAAGLVCAARYGATAPCDKEPDVVLNCNDNNGHQSDWCECRRPSGGVDAGSPDSGSVDTAGHAEACLARSGSLSAGQTHTVEIDGFTGDEHTTEPKTDSNDGQNRDNPQFRRHNVARAHNDYWYTSQYQLAGEPSPSGEQWVDYAPDFNGLGVGCYHIVARYRGTDARALYPVEYHVVGTAAGDQLFHVVQERIDAAYRDIDLGNHAMCAGGYVRVKDPGDRSITFNRMRFIYLGPQCP